MGNLYDVWIKIYNLLNFLNYNYLFHHNQTFKQNLYCCYKSKINTTEIGFKSNTNRSNSSLIKSPKLSNKNSESIEKYIETKKDEKINIKSDSGSINPEQKDGEM